MLDRYDRYPHKLAVTEKCMGPEIARKVAVGQLENATATFLHRVERFRAHAREALTIAQKEKIFPHLENLVRCGWPVEYARAVIESRGADAKSLSWAEAALGSIGAFSQEHGMKYRHTITTSCDRIHTCFTKGNHHGNQKTYLRKPAVSA